MSGVCYLCSYTRKKQKQGVTLHRFPRDVPTLKLWFLACGLQENVDDVKNVRICTSHFDPRDVWRAEYGRKYPTLKSGAVPSVSVPYVIPTRQLNASRPSTDVLHMTANSQIIEEPLTASDQLGEETCHMAIWNSETQTVSDIKSPDVTRAKTKQKVLLVRKISDIKKYAMIKKLQDENKLLREQVASLKRLVEYLQTNGCVCREGEIC